MASSELSREALEAEREQPERWLALNGIIRQRQVVYAKIAAAEMHLRELNQEDLTPEGINSWWQRRDQYNAAHEELMRLLLAEEDVLLGNVQQIASQANTQREWIDAQLKQLDTPQEEA